MTVELAVTDDDDVEVELLVAELVAVLVEEAVAVDVIVPEDVEVELLVAELVAVLVEEAVAVDVVVPDDVEVELLVAELVAVLVEDAVAVAEAVAVDVAVADDEPEPDEVELAVSVAVLVEEDVAEAVPESDDDPLPDSVRSGGLVFDRRAEGESLPVFEFVTEGVPVCEVVTVSELVAEEECEDGIVGNAVLDASVVAEILDVPVSVDDTTAVFDTAAEADTVDVATAVPEGFLESDGVADFAAVTETTADPVVRNTVIVGDPDAVPDFVNFAELVDDEDTVAVAVVDCVERCDCGPEAVRVTRGEVLDETVAVFILVKDGDNDVVTDADVEAVEEDDLVEELDVVEDLVADFVAVDVSVALLVVDSVPDESDDAVADKLVVEVVVGDVVGLDDLEDSGDVVDVDESDAGAVVPVGSAEAVRDVVEVAEGVKVPDVVALDDTDIVTRSCVPVVVIDTMGELELELEVVVLAEAVEVPKALEVTVAVVDAELQEEDVVVDEPVPDDDAVAVDDVVDDPVTVEDAVVVADVDALTVDEVEAVCSALAEFVLDEVPVGDPVFVEELDTVELAVLLEEDDADGDLLERADADDEGVEEVDPDVLGDAVELRVARALAVTDAEWERREDGVNDMDVDEEDERDPSQLKRHGPPKPRLGVLVGVGEVVIAGVIDVEIEEVVESVFERE